MIAAVVVWALLVVLYAAKWIGSRQEAVSELSHPVQCCFVGLFPVSTMLVAFAVLPYDHLLATMLGAIGALGQMVFSVYRTGTLWTGGRDPLATTPVLYLPTVAGNFVSANLASALGFGDLAALFFGAGVLAWIARIHLDAQALRARRRWRSRCDPPSEFSLRRPSLDARPICP